MIFSPFRMLREWAVPMALTGTLNAVDRGLVDSGRHLVVHGSGVNSTAGYRPLELSATVGVGTVEDVAGAVLGR